MQSWACFDDLNILEFIVLSDQLVTYDVQYHIPSDIGIDQLFLSPSEYNMQDNLNYISEWTSQNLMLLNEKKSAYIVFSRTKSEFSTRLTLNGTLLERQTVFKILGLWLQEDLKWDFNTRQICKKAYSRMYILNKLKFAGIHESDLIIIFKLFIRSVCE